MTSFFTCSLHRCLVAITGGFVLASIAQGDDSAAKPHLEVGPFQASAPYGLAILVNRESAFAFNPEVDAPTTHWSAHDEGLLPYGTNAPDGSYFTTTFQHGGATITFTYGKISDIAVGATLTANHDVTLPINLAQPWSGCQTVYDKEADGVRAFGIDARTGASTVLQIRTRPAPSAIEAKSQWTGKISLDLKAGQTTVLVASIGELPSFDSVAPALAQAAKAYDSKRIAAEGDWGNFLGAIADSMNGSLFFSSLDRRVIHAVGRGWWIFNQGGVSQNADYAPLFGWDSCFNGNLASLEDPEHARDTIRAVLSYQLANGMVGNYSHWPADYMFVSVDRSDPPVGALCVWKMHQRQPDLAFLAEVYPRLVKWHDWWHTQRAGKDGWLLSWGGNDNNAQEARWETGWDDTKAFPGAKMEGNRLCAYAVDLNSLWAMDAENLVKIATALGKNDDAKRFQDDHDRMVKAMNDKLWNEKLGLYCNRMWDDNSDGSPKFLTRITPMNFYPLICGAPDKAQAARMLDYFYQPTKFWGQWMVPTLAYDDPDWKKQEYWNGHVWAPVNYLLWQGMVRYADPAHQAEFARRSVALFMQNWKTDQRYCSENYSSVDGKATDHPHYTWGALLPLIGLEALIDIDAGLKPVPRKLPITENLTLHHIPVGGKLYRIEAKGGAVTVTPE
jgi:hypothetical protein